MNSRGLVATATSVVALGAAYAFAPVPCACNTPTYGPSVSMTAPADGATVSGVSVTVSASASAAAGVTGVQFQADSVNIGAQDTTAPYSVTWNSTGVTDGVHTLTAIATDGNGATSSSSVTVHVSNGGGGLTANRFMSTTGTDSGTCSTSGTACLTLNYAYQQSVQGDVIQMACGTYDGQTVAYDASKASDTSYITVQPASAGCVQIGHQTTLGANANFGDTTLTVASTSGFSTGAITVGKWTLTCSTISSGTLFSGCSGGSSSYAYLTGGQVVQGNLTLQGTNYLKLNGINASRLLVQNSSGNTNNHLYITNGTFAYFNISDTQNSTFTNNTVGPWGMEDPPFLSTSNGAGNVNMQFTHDTLHDINSRYCSASMPSCAHMECVFIEYTSGLNFSYNKVYNCSGTASVFVQKVGSPGGNAATRLIDDMTVSNNYFGYVLNWPTNGSVSSSGHSFGIDTASLSLVVNNFHYYNNSGDIATASGEIAFMHETNASYTGTNRVWGNTGWMTNNGSSCTQFSAVGIDVKYNVWGISSGATTGCDATDKGISTATGLFTDVTGDDMDLTANTSADNFVPAANCQVTDDYHGTARGNPCDAGAYER